MDTISKEERSLVMSRIRSKDTKPELMIRSWLHKRGFRFRLHSESIPGHPDVVMKKHKTIIEVRGCFWHHHEGCDEARVPKSNVRFWKEKLKRNMARDTKNEILWRDAGWNVVVVWACELKPKRREETLRRVERMILAGAGEYPETRSDIAIAAEAGTKYDVS